MICQRTIYIHFIGGISVFLNGTLVEHFANLQKKNKRKRISLKTKLDELKYGLKD
jgi:hypothetical protein